MVAERLRLFVLLADAAPCPCLSFIDTYGRATVADGRAFQKREDIVSRFVEFRTELPVEPVSCGITQLTLQHSLVTVNLFNDDIAAGQLIVNSHEYTLFLTTFHDFS